MSLSRRRRQPEHGQPRALADLVRRLHHAAVRLLRDDVLHLHGRPEEDGEGRRRVPWRVCRMAPALGHDGAPLPGVPGARRCARLRGAVPWEGRARSPTSGRGCRSGSTRSGEARVDLKLDPRGLVISVSEAASFPVGRADIDGDAQHLFHEIAVTLGGAAQRGARRRAHRRRPDSHVALTRPTGSLSTARATSVVAYFVQSVGLSPDRLSAAGLRRVSPAGRRTTRPQARARNRRVDIIVLNPQTRDREEPSAGAAPGTLTTTRCRCRRSCWAAASTAC